MKNVLLILFALGLLTFISCSKNTPVNDVIFTSEEQEIFRKWSDRVTLYFKEVARVTPEITKHKMEVKFVFFEGNFDYKAGDKVEFRTEKKDSLYTVFQKLNGKEKDKRSNKSLHDLLNKFSSKDVNLVKDLNAKLKSNLKNISLYGFINEDFIQFGSNELDVSYDKEDTKYTMKLRESDILIKDFSSTNLKEINNFVYNFIIDYDKNTVVFTQDEKDYFKNWTSNDFKKLFPNGTKCIIDNITDTKLVAIISTVDDTLTYKLTINKIEKYFHCIEEEIQVGRESSISQYSHNDLKKLLTRTL